MMNKISLAIMAQCFSNRNDIMIPNFYLGSYEMDVVKILASNYVVEYEIKTSRSDYKADFLKSNYAGSKHDALKCGSLECNRFYFVVPDGMILPEEVPNYAGLMYYQEDGDIIRTIKNAKLLHKREFKDYRSIARTLQYRESMARNKCLRLQKLLNQK